MFLLFSGLKRGLEKFEIPTALTLIGESWTPESGVITAAFKLKRKVIQNIYQRDIDKMYAWFEFKKVEFSKKEEKKTSAINNKNCLIHNWKKDSSTKISVKSYLFWIIWDQIYSKQFNSKKSFNFIKFLASYWFLE